MWIIPVRRWWPMLTRMGLALRRIVFAIIGQLKRTGRVQFAARQKIQVMPTQMHGVPTQRPVRQLTASAAQRRDGEKSNREPRCARHLLASVPSSTPAHQRRSSLLFIE